jgi:hypothetical protein
MKYIEVKEHAKPPKKRFKEKTLPFWQEGLGNCIRSAVCYRRTVFQDALKYAKTGINLETLVFPFLVVGDIVNVRQANDVARAYFKAGNV